MSRLSRAHRVEVFDSGLAEAVRDLRCGDDSRNGMTIAHGLAQGDNIWNNVLAIQLEGPHMAADSSETDLDLIRDADASSFAHVSAKEANRYNYSRCANIIKYKTHVCALIGNIATKYN